MTEVVVVRGRIAKRVREEAGRLGVSVDEYVVELLSEGLDPRDRALEYIEAAMDLLGQARGELGKGNVRQASEKLWGAAALAVKAYAYWRDGKRLTSHGELWEYMRLMVKELGSWVRGAWMYANGMHTCFYEGWCARDDVEDAFKNIGKLVREVASMVKRRSD
ncbi:MAG: hypothetical protein DSY37_03235 [Hyperthermus sp.]|nr:MAG: hypothetical protein DSY37_03235 [Hyperthermus sp.]